jgi:hypothetical protein
MDLFPISLGPLSPGAGVSTACGADPVIARGTFLARTGVVPYLNPTRRPTADPAKWSNNLWFGAGAAPSWDTNPLNADPKLVSSMSPYDLHLRASSPAIGAGVATPNFAPLDFDGLSRPVSSTSDIGAYQYSGSRP